MAIGSRMLGKTALVTGAGSGIGRAVAQRFAEEGAWVACVDMNLQAARETCAMLAHGGQAMAADVSVEADVERALQQVNSSRATLDVVVNSAGIAGPQVAAALTPLDGWRRTLDVNLTGTFLVCKHALPVLITSRGNIVNVASALALVAKADEAAYHASKAGVVQLSRSMAMDYAATVRVNCVCPGAVRTPMIESVLPPGLDKEQALAEYGKIHPLHQRLAFPREIADAILFLASDDASLITGVAMAVDAGYSMS
jgi:NAD(P)-dependent dehydrogenase (short-subunit alcohol dehydrogenase family)